LLDLLPEVNMNGIRLLAATSLLAFASAAAGQANESRGNTPPGMSRDGAGPGDGAITGGSIKPGESGGVPSRDPIGSREEALKRCRDLEGQLREQSMRDAESAGSGASVPPMKAPSGGSEIPPRVTPPAQNPR
jgi:hypothetical protein